MYEELFMGGQKNCCIRFGNNRIHMIVVIRL